MTTALDIIEPAMRKIHVLGRGQSLQNDDAQNALDALNALFDSWSIEGGIVYVETIETFNLTNSASYTIGSGGDFDTQRPYEIKAAYVSTSSNTDHPLVAYDEVQYSNLSDKDTLGYPQVYYFNNDFPLATIRLYPVPNDVTTITITSRKPLTRFTSLTDDLALPEGFERMAIYNLAVEQAPEYEKEASMAVKQIAHDSKIAVLGSNKRNANNSMTSDLMYMGSRGNYNIRRDF